MMAAAIQNQSVKTCAPTSHGPRLTVRTEQNRNNANGQTQLTLMPILVHTRPEVGAKDLDRVRIVGSQRDRSVELSAQQHVRSDSA